MITPKLTLVGAGPGDEELITLKGIRAIEKADVILYDALANPNLLRYAREDALKVFVGKRAGQHLFQQRQINQMIIQYARQCGHVVRLKGGDPFVFGRGQEEKEYAEKHGIQVEVVPGISSALAVPASNHIPLTHRGLNESFWVLTGTIRKKQLSEDLRLAAQSSATIVILMGMKRLPEITALFSGFRQPNEPVAIIQNGTLPEEKICIGQLDNIVKLAESQKMSSPAIIVIGTVVEKHWKFVKQQVNYLHDETEDQV